MKNLQPLAEELKRAQQPRFAIEALDVLGVELAAREESLLAACDLNDKKSFAEIAELHIKNEIVPRKRTALEKDYTAGCALLNTAIDAAFPAFHELRNQRTDALLTTLTRQLKPIFPDEAELPRQVQAAWSSNKLAQRIESLGMTFEFSTSAGNREPEAVAAKMLANFAELEAITIPAKL